jgi:putative DNA primase/helicase
VIATVLGDYAGPIAAEALLADPRGFGRERAQTVAALCGKRLVVASEPDSGMRLSEGTIKSLTGAETVEGRHLYGRPFKVKPTWHPHFTVNHKPVVRGTDHGIWRRVHLVPWNAKFEGSAADPHLKERLLEEADGILTWLVAGCALYWDLGLRPPVIVTEATAEYRKENDRFGAWLEERCEIDPSAETSSADLFNSYKQWCEENREFCSNQTAFGRELTARRFDGQKVGGRRAWRGIRLALGH